MSDSRPVRFLPDFADPADTYTRAAAELIHGAADPKHAFHWPAVATVAPDGLPVVRTVVMRAFDPAARIATFHTDSRAQKVVHLRADSRLALHFYDPAARYQVRMPATARLHCADDTARAEWCRLSAASRATYATADPPGAMLPAAAPVAAPPPVEEADLAAFAHFLVVMCRFDELELLELHPDGNRRACLVWVENRPQLTRLAP